MRFAGIKQMKKPGIARKYKNKYGVPITAKMKAANAKKKAGIGGYIRHKLLRRVRYNNQGK